MAKLIAHSRFFLRNYINQIIYNIKYEGLVTQLIQNIFCYDILEVEVLISTTNKLFS